MIKVIDLKQELVNSNSRIIIGRLNAEAVKKAKSQLFKAIKKSALTKIK